MNIFSKIKGRIEKEQSLIHQNPHVNTKGIGVPLEITVDISIDEMIELSNTSLIQPQQKLQLRKKIETYYKGVEMFGENRVLPVINQYGNIIIWID